MTSKRITDTLRALLGPVQSVPTIVDVTIRFARPDEADALATLARLDSSHTPQGNVLVADVRGELWAAVSVDDGQAVANPFRPSGELTFRLAERARALQRVGADGRPPRGLGASSAWASRPGARRTKPSPRLPNGLRPAAPAASPPSR
jgi:hypothetical protein